MSQLKPLPGRTPWPTSMDQLETAERLVVWAFRRWVLGFSQHGGEYWSEVRGHFTNRFGTHDAKEALSGLAFMIKELQCGARRTIQHHQPFCPCVGNDEVCLFSFVAACQNRQPQLARALAERMVQPDGVGGFLDAGGRLARVLRRHIPSPPPRIRNEELAAGLYWPGIPEATVH